MNYKDYQNSRDMAWKILLQENVTEMPVRVGDLCRQMEIKVAYYDLPDNDDGKSTIVEGQPWILIAKDKPVQRQRFTCAHELGHILLGHTGKYVLVNREPSRGDNPIEQEANVFASRLLAPACVLWALNARTPEEIAELCDISYQAAKFRSERMDILYKRDKFLTSPLERAVYEQFSNFIRNRGGLL